MTKKIKKIAKYFFIGILLLIPVVLITAYLKFPSFVKNNLSEWVANRSGNLYKLSFQDIRLNLKNMSLSMSDVELVPDREIARLINEKYPEKVIYSFNSPEVRIDNISIRQYLRSKSFRCGQLKIVKPRLDISGTSTLLKDSVATFHYLFREIQPLFNQKISEIKIGEIIFENAEYELYRFLGDTSRISNADKISVAIRNFRTDSLTLSDTGDPFRSDDIEIRMSNFHTLMGDSIHQTNIGSLIYSLKNSEIRAADFHLFPVIHSKRVSCYDVFVPQFYLKSSSIMNLSIDDTLMVDSLEFLNPTIRYYEKMNQKKFRIEDINNFDLYTLVKNQFRIIRISNFFLSGARLEIYRQPDTVNYLQQFKKIEIHLSNFKLDSLSARDTESLFHSGELEMKLSGYRLKLDDNRHEFSADTIFVSTLHKRIGAKKILIRPLHQGDSTAATIRAECRILSFDQTDLKKLYHSRDLNSAVIRIIKPDVKVSYPADYKKREKSGKPGLLYELVSAYLRGVHAGKVKVESGLLNLINLKGKEVTGYIGTGFDFQLDDFQLDSLSFNNPERFFFAKGFNIRFPGFGMKLVDNLHQLKAAMISISSNGNTVVVDSLCLNPVTGKINGAVLQRFGRSEAYRVVIPRIILAGTNLHEAWFNNQLFIDQFTISNPDFSLETFSTLKTKKTTLEEFYRLILNYIGDIQINRFEIPEGVLLVTSHSKKEKTISFNSSFTASLRNFRFNEAEIKKEKLLFSDDFDFTIYNQSFGLSDSVHSLKAAKIRFSNRNSSIDVEDAQLFPDTSAEEYATLKTTFRVSIPGINLKGVDLNKVLKKKEVEVDILSLDSPALSVYTLKQNQVRKSMKDFSVPVPAILNSLKVGKFNLERGKVITISRGQGKIDTTSSFGLRFIADNIAYSKGSEMRVDDFSAGLSAFSIKLGENGNRGSFEKLSYNKTDKVLIIKNISLNTARAEPGSNRVSIRIPAAEFTGFDAEKSLKTDEYVFNRVHLNEPVILFKSAAGSGQADKININKAILPYANSIHANFLALEKAGIDISGNGKPFQLQNFNMTFRDVDIGAGGNSGKIFNSAEFGFATGKIERKSKNGYYRFSTDSVTYQSQKQKLELKGVKIVPVFDRQKFEELKGFQADYFMGEISRITISQPDLNAWSGGKKIISESLVIGKSAFSVFRNKRLPFNRDQRPLMPVQLIESISSPFRFDSVICGPADISYSELTAVTDNPGKVTFEDVILKTGTITNIKPLPEAFNARATGKLMNSGSMTAEISFGTKPPDYRHTVKAGIGTMSLSAMNEVLENTALLSIESGNLNRFDVELTNTDKSAAGKLWFGYDDLKINVLKQDETGYKTAKFTSFIANSFGLPSKNPKEKTLEPVLIKFDRDEKRSFLSYWWKTIFAGAKEVLGIKEKEKK